MAVIILGIESSCDDTAAALISDGFLLSSVINSQEIHKQYGGVVPELASRAHQQNIIPVVDTALKEAGIERELISAVAYTRGPGLLGSLLVGSCFAKGFALAGNLKLIEVNHLHAHVLSCFVSAKQNTKKPEFPFLCLLVSGGHTQIIRVTDYLDLEVFGSTIDDAAGEAFDKCAKLMGMPYPGGPLVDLLAKDGDPDKFSFAKPRIPSLDFSFSGLKTSFLYFLRDQMQHNPLFIEQNKNDLCASIQKTIIDILTAKLTEAVRLTGICNITLAGGVAANSGLRTALGILADKNNWQLFLPDKKLTTDNAAMIAMTGYYKYLAGRFSGHDDIPKARYNINDP